MKLAHKRTGLASAASQGEPGPSPRIQVSNAAISQRDRAGVILPLIALIVYLAVSIFFIVDPLRHVHARRRRQAAMQVSADG